MGMCGPIAMSLPSSEGGFTNELIHKTLYNGGRVFTYSVMGGIFGLLGHGISLAGLQRPLSVFLGIMVILGASLPALSEAGIQRFAPVRSFFGWLQSKLKQQFNNRGLSTMWTVGVLNGLLPCGFVYVGLASSLTTGSVLSGMSFMALFGAGTLPAMMVMSVAPKLISLEMRRRLNRYLPMLAMLLGAYLIYRGLLMGAPH